MHRSFDGDKEVSNACQWMIHLHWTEIIKLVMEETDVRKKLYQVGSSCNASDLYSRSAQIEF
jgi:hypothetical protein